MLNNPRLESSAEVGGFLTIRKYRAGELVWQSEPIHNKVVSGAGGYGRNIIARQLAGDTTYSMEIDSAAVGDDATAPADSDTGLGNSLVSGIPLTNVTVTNNSIQVDVFVADGTLPNDTYAEFALFCNGRIFCRILIDPAYTKATGEDTLFTYSMSITG